MPWLDIYGGSTVEPSERRELMLTEIRRDKVCQMVAGGAVLVEVLPEEEYEAEHLPGAINIPLQQLDRQTTAVLHQDQPVIVYCYDSQ
jgi:rhodanese-related sulfurtransferase